MAGKIRLPEIADIISRYKILIHEGKGVGESCGIIAQEFGRSQGTIYALIRRFRSTAEGAEAYFRANALKLAMRVVRKANVDQSINILERANMGVLAPNRELGTGQQGFFLSVEADSCGAIKITGGMSQTGESSATSGAARRVADTSEPDYIDIPPAPVEQIERASEASEFTNPRRLQTAEPDEPSTRRYNQPGVPHPTQGTVLKPMDRDQKATIEAHKKRLKEARRLAQMSHMREEV